MSETPDDRAALRGDKVAPQGDAPASSPPSGPPGDRASGRVTEWKGFRLSLFQIQAVEALNSGENVLVSAPTGAGKTLVAEYAIADAVARGRRCVYTAPIKALSNQKYRDFRDDPDIDVGLMTGDVTIHAGAQVLIMTTEILRNAVLEAPENLHDVDYVIFDEIHFMDDPERGCVWEESLIFAPPEIRVIALSATIDNLEQLGAWMNEIRPHELRVIQSTKRPVPLKHRLHVPKRGLFAAPRLDFVRRQAKGGARRSSNQKGRGGRNGGRRGRAPGTGGLQPEALDDLFDHLQEKELLPTLVFSFSRKDCERLARRNRSRRLLDEDEAERMRALQRELIDLFQLDEAELDGEVFRLATHGVGYHHAGMLPIHKEVVERMFTSGLTKLLFTTETFALGINMPARTVVFASLRKFDGVGFDYLRTRDYLQMAGRAGRQGIDREGLVVSSLDARALDEAPVHRIQSGRAEPVLSRFRLSYASILHLYGSRGPEGVHEAWEKSFNQYQHRAKNKKARERNRRIQRALVESHFALLAELGYIDVGAPASSGAEDAPIERLSPRGRIARLFYGFELQITEMLFRGVFETIPPQAFAIIFVGLVHENRGRGGGPVVPARFFGGVRRHVDQVVRSIARAETKHAIPTPLKEPDWGLTEAVALWYDGARFLDLEEELGITAGDVCRTFRMALQLMRQMRRALDDTEDLQERLGDAISAMNRREVDARHQLELG